MEPQTGQASTMISRVEIKFLIRLASQRHPVGSSPSGVTMSKGKYSFQMVESLSELTRNH